MTSSDFFWTLFEKTGSVSIYLIYRETILDEEAEILKTIAK